MSTLGKKVQDNLTRPRFGDVLREVPGATKKVGRSVFDFLTKNTQNLVSTAVENLGSAAAYHFVPAVRQAVDSGKYVLPPMQQSQTAGLKKIGGQMLGSAAELAPWAHGKGIYETGKMIGETSRAINKVGPSMARKLPPTDYLRLALRGGKSGAGYGSAYGLSGALRGDSGLKDAVLQTLTGTGMGVVGGAALSPALGFLGAHGNEPIKLNNSRKGFVKIPGGGLGEQGGAWAGGIGLPKGKNKVQGEGPLEDLAAKASKEYGSTPKDQKAFSEAFKKSLRKDDGQTLFHGTRTGNKFDVFDESKVNAGGNNAFNQGNVFYTTDSKQAAKYFSQKANETSRLSDKSLSPLQRNTGSSGVGEVMEFKLKPSAKIAQLDHYPSVSEINALKGKGFDGAKFSEAGFKNVQDWNPSMGAFPKDANTTVLFNKSAITHNKVLRTLDDPANINQFHHQDVKVLEDFLDIAGQGKKTTPGMEANVSTLIERYGLDGGKSRASLRKAAESLLQQATRVEHPIKPNPLTGEAFIKALKDQSTNQGSNADFARPTAALPKLKPGSAAAKKAKALLDAMLKPGAKW